MKIWIDLSNSPHALLFAPVTRELESLGHHVLVTARDNAQTVELATERWPGVEVIGGASPKGRRAKLATLGRRIADLRSWARAARPDVALSHNSYAQIVAARSIGMPAVTAMDFEHQPANHVAFRLAKTVLLPEPISAATVKRQGATARKVVRYPGLKEELYIGDFEPDGRVLEALGFRVRPRVLVVMRTPPNRALYHPGANPLFEDALRAVCDLDDAACVVLARHPEQVSALHALSLPNCLVPAAALDSRSLMYAADALIGAGGTMTREAALIGIPTWTAFAGSVPAVDLWLERRGQLARLSSPEQLRDLQPRRSPPRTPAQLRERAAPITQAFIDATLSAA